MEDCHVSEKAASMPGDRPRARKFTIKGRIRSFRCALAGLMLMLKTQHNAWLHAVASIGVLSAGALFGLSEAEWCVLVLAIAVVWTAEALNTALELLADAASPEFHPLVAKAKDVAAAAVDRPARAGPAALYVRCGRIDRRLGLRPGPGDDSFKDPAGSAATMRRCRASRPGRPARRAPMFATFAT